MIERPTTPSDTLGDLRPIEVLYEFDRPCIFTAQAPFGALLLVYLMEEQAAGVRYLVTTINRLTSGQTSVREALVAGALWVADQNHRGVVTRVETTSPESLPDDALPDAHTMLWAHLEPARASAWKGAESVGQPCASTGRRATECAVA
jgi:hypothetical protein